MSDDIALGIADRANQQTIRLTKAFFAKLEGLGLYVRGYTINDSVDNMLTLMLECLVAEDSEIVVPLDRCDGNGDSAKEGKHLTFTNKVGDGDFENPVNWEPQCQPQKGDRLTIETVGTVFPGPITNIDPTRTLETISVLDGQIAIDV